MDCYSKTWHCSVSLLRFFGIGEQFSFFTIACLTAISTGGRIRITQLNVLKISEMASNGLSCSIHNNIIIVDLNMCKRSAWYHLEELSKLKAPRSNSDHR